MSSKLASEPTEKPYSQANEQSADKIKYDKHANWTLSLLNEWRTAQKSNNQLNPKGKHSR